jgi:hypothetical protein
MGKILRYPVFTEYLHLFHFSAAETQNPGKPGFCITPVAGR